MKRRLTDYLLVTQGFSNETSKSAVKYYSSFIHHLLKQCSIMQTQLYLITLHVKCFNVITFYMAV